MKRLTYFCLYFYCLFLVLIGGILGLFVPKWAPISFEVYYTTVFNTDMDAASMASALNQCRFMKSLQFGFGLLGLLFVKEIVSIEKFNYYFAGIMLPGTFERGLCYIIDGSPGRRILCFPDRACHVADPVYLLA